jgi:hypothetical protein
MKWFNRWFANKCKQAWEDSQTNCKIVATDGRYGSVKTSKELDSNGLNLVIYSADGGTVLEFRSYDFQKDRHENSLYVISQNENFEERVAHSITMELLKRRP